MALARTARLIGAHEERIVLRAAHLSRRPLQAIMLPASEISMIPVDALLEDALVQAHLDLHPRFPICAQVHDPQTIQGYINFKDLVVFLKMEPRTDTVRGIMRPITRPSAPMTIAQALERMVCERIHIALVVSDDERVIGLVILEDLIEELMGDIDDEFDRLPTHVHPAGSGWIVGGGASLRALAARDPARISDALCARVRRTYHRPRRIAREGFPGAHGGGRAAMVPDH